jgi:citrate lyase subunit beta/citryl-CoA lyase
MLAKILSMKSSDVPDAFVPDLEDSVPIDQKDNARKITSKFLREYQEQKNYLVIPRVNATLGDDVLYNDLASVVLPSVDAITFGKAESLEQLDKICRMMTDIEKTNRVGTRIKLIPTIETAKGIVNANQLCASNPGRIIGVAFGADDCTFK